MSSAKTDTRGPTLLDLLPNDGDAVFVLRKHGRAGMAYVRHGDKLLRMPHKVNLAYAKAPAPQLTLRKITVSAGWTETEYAALADDLKGIEAESADVQ